MGLYLDGGVLTRGRSALARAAASGDGRITTLASLGGSDPGDRIGDSTAGSQEEIDRLDVALGSGLDKIEFGELLKPLGIEHPHDARVPDPIAQPRQAQGRVR